MILHFRLSRPLEVDADYQPALAGFLPLLAGNGIPKSGSFVCYHTQGGIDTITHMIFIFKTINSRRKLQ